MTDAKKIWQELYYSNEVPPKVPDSDAPLLPTAPSPW
jgi:hypothetical protein